MNLSLIASKVAEMVPEAQNVRARSCGGGVYALVCDMAGKTKSVQFDSTGLYGANQSGMWTDWPKSEIYIAAEIVKELRK